jgi:hypothetical protein
LSQDFKRKALVFIVIAMVLTALLGATLPRLAFQPGLPPPSLENGQVAVRSSAGEASTGIPVHGFVLVLILITAAGVLLYSIYRLLKGIPWKDLLSSIFTILFTVLVLFGLIFLILSRLSTEALPADAEPIPTPMPVITAPLGATPPLLIWFVAAGLLIATVLLAVWLLRTKPKTTPDLWKLEAQKARDALLSGQGLKDVILQCYQRMSLALQEEQHIQREVDMTAAEFERLLTAKGVPPDPVHQLTQLFEAVRYGQWLPGPGDEQKAIHSLEAILDYSREARLEA